VPYLFTPPLPPSSCHFGHPLLTHSLTSTLTFTRPVLFSEADVDATVEAAVSAVVQTLEAELGAAVASINDRADKIEVTLGSFARLYSLLPLCRHIKTTGISHSDSLLLRRLLSKRPRPAPLPPVPLLPRHAPLQQRH
jgi:hypothetical protein